MNTLLDQDMESEEALEFLLQLQQQKLDLNKVSREQLDMLQLLSPAQIEQFINYRNAVGGLFSVYELQSIPAFDTIVCRRLAAVGFVNDPNTLASGRLLKQLFREKNNYLLFHYQLPSRKKAGFMEGDSARGFGGDLGKTMLRFRVSHPGSFSAGFTAEQDEGERWALNGRHVGFDYWSGHVQLENNGRLGNLIIGDFQAQFGQGLAIGGIFGLGKSSVTVSGIRKSNVGFIPYTSAYESGGLRGFAVSYRFGRNTHLHAFISNVKRDGVIRTDTSGRRYITTLTTNGTHRIQRELASRKKNSGAAGRNHRRLQETKLGVRRFGQRSQIQYHLPAGAVARLRAYAGWRFFLPGRRFRQRRSSQSQHLQRSELSIGCSLHAFRCTHKPHVAP
ncbi:MAG: helix-hairpin-helix domain-containing protein [Bacteroidia bacterium]|nr:helix-hairpin-helix domain-containing protein [Bacteroidia bacterium]